jgi:hypothetical protein
MIKSLKLIFLNKSENLSLEIFDTKIKILIQEFSFSSVNSFDIEIVFNDAVDLFRTHDYQWVKSDRELIAPTFTPKVLKLKNGFFVQPNIQQGIWEFNPKFKNKILWRFNPDNAAMLTKYSGNKNEKIIQKVSYSFDVKQEIALLFSKKNAIEFSRSPIPFSAVACFTDHCDFDTLENVKLQREFFKENGVKVTKGFFLNHYSKRKDNASFENDAEELSKWENDGHELCYHSLSQSIKNDKDSFDDFCSFQSPIKSVPTWIDHGYQPYNLSLYQNMNFGDADFEEVLIKNKISNLWNYIDSGTSTLGVINQLNSNDFTLKSYFNGIKDLKIKDKIALKIKIILFHYYADEKMIMKYKNISSCFKKFIEHKSFKQLFFFFRNLISISIPLLKVFFFWNSIKNKPFPLAKYSPLIFKHRIQDNDFSIFQTLEMVDFKKSLAPKNINKLIDESGIFIAHTYFSVPMKYHFGKLFKTETLIDNDVATNFSYLGEKVRSNQVWNPTLNELVQFLSKFENIKLDINESGNIFCIDNLEVPFREIS